MRRRLQISSPARLCCGIDVSLSRKKKYSYQCIARKSLTIPPLVFENLFTITELNIDDFFSKEGTEASALLHNSNITSNTQIQ